MEYIIERHVPKHVKKTLGEIKTCAKINGTSKKGVKMKDTEGNETFKVDRCSNKKCRKAYSEKDFYPKQLTCKACQKNKKRGRASKQRIRDRLIQCCRCLGKKHLMFVTSRPVSTYKTMKEIDELPVICIGCFIDNQLK